MFGEVADLGSGWGYLSKEALRLNEKSRELHYLRVIIQHILRQKNIDDKRATFRWASLENITNLQRRFNHVICNPPFTRTHKDLGLLKSFIFQLQVDKCSRVRLDGFCFGSIFGDELHECFENIKILYKDKHYFVYYY